ncbi:hypothetical protein EMIHUDRAFT_222007 [Emiliania huxleyi CCMP1516]|uniref:Phospholipase/carboxylesterase/thioesterase domain-containing protein n=2 Tax=Emiliania huxleyi TaxID=2903 RepID=A0A0D3KZ00_EMIH1|nr:hypothetical protein EMIHUDRAFT_222007 [Emiliania huxleyi CCMP1516]EOD40985.1 hypothetical protein EMIHUDRAFT_222007 [Emiliania huxleyi CCMP1516]|eukprot:XP_005793414.1 hypothetical protein EMIHUDRAFT_222007 [Emiliania huxleyi CCMP1516]
MQHIPAMALLRAPIVIIEPTAVHSHSLILLHGMHCDGRMFQRLPQILTALGGNASGTRFIFPSSPDLSPACVRGETLAVQKPLRERTVLSSPSREQAVHRLLDAEVASLGGDPSRVAIGGNSQGGTVAIHAALTYPKPLAALFSLCSILLDVTPAPPALADRLPVYVFTAEFDQEYAPRFQHKCFKRLADVGFRLFSHVEPGAALSTHLSAGPPRLDHYTTSTAELHHAAAWASLALHGRPLPPVTYRDVPSAVPQPPLDFYHRGAGAILSEPPDGGAAGGWWASWWGTSGRVGANAS